MSRFSSRCVLLAQTAPWTTPWGHPLALPVWTRINPNAFALALAAGAATIKFKVNAVLVVIAGAALSALA